MTDLSLMSRLTRSGTTKIVLLVMDGLGGLPRESGGPTELEAARTPHLDRLATEGMLGLMHTVRIGVSPGSGPGHLGLFGYDPLTYLIGRGALEAVGIGLSLTDQDVAARGNFCTVDATGTITDRRAGRISTEECARMVRLIEDITLPDVELIVKPVQDYRFVLILRAPGLSSSLNETDPQQVGMKPLVVEAQDGSAEASRTASLVNQWVAEVKKRIKDEHPANMVTLRGWASAPGLPAFGDVFKLKAAALAVYPMYKGLASLVGMHQVHGLADLDDQLAALKSEWDSFDFFFVHYKYTDSRGEDGDFDAKVAEIEKVDRVIPRVLSLKPDVLVVTGDHSTPAVLKSHSWHPVPVLFWAPGVSRTNPQVTGFGESQCLLGALGQFNATDLMPLITAHALRQAKFGA
ncbi:MAG: 2,3-bisphosphoglycerate-independent phosphoglycerate mutase [Desulfomonilaceae bacterium]|nr:2,3-bisphosphoglycerate-independent phosphoglycerate mutase [Desulfomonilaceae bacterium]